MIVPAVTAVCRPQLAHSHVHGLVCSSHALLVPQPGQTKPCGQRAAKRYLTHAASSEKRCWNSIDERGKSLTVGSDVADVCYLFYPIPARCTTTNRVTGHTGISLIRYTGFRKRICISAI